jgi:protease-4
LGGINDAISIAAKKAKLTSYRTIALPEKREFFEKLVEDLNTEAKMYFAKSELGENYYLYEKLKDLTKLRGIMARMPFEIKLEP